MLRAKDDDIKTLKATIDRANERERNVQFALEEQRQVSCLLREQLHREKTEKEAAIQTIDEQEVHAASLKGQAERDKERQKRLEADLHDQHGIVLQLKEDLSE